MRFFRTFNTLYTESIINVSIIVYMMEEILKGTVWTKGGTRMGLDCNTPDNHDFVQFFMFFLSSLVTRCVCRTCYLALWKIFLKSPFP